MEGNNWIYNCGAKGEKIFSQQSEDGIIRYIFSNIKPTNKYFVEFGVEDGSECNTRYLQENGNWKGLRLDGGYDDSQRFLHKELITPDNIVSLFLKYSVPNKFDLLSVDTDMFDYWILKSILEGGYRPRVLIVEINSSLGPVVCKSVPWPMKGTTVWDKTNYFGVSVAAYHALGKNFGYSMVYCEESGVNCFLVQDDLIGGSKAGILTPALLFRPPRYGQSMMGHPSDLKERLFVEVPC
jgi:hypothetical protein